MDYMGLPTAAGALAPSTPLTNGSRDESARFALAALDVDDTLLGPDWRISDENAAAVRWLQGRGVQVVLASGRSHANMLRFHHALDLDDAPIISSQGAMVRRADGSAPWLEQRIAPDLVARVTRDGLERGFAVQHYTSDSVLVQGRSQWTDYDQTRNDAPHARVDDLLAQTGEGVVKVIWLGAPAEIAMHVVERAAAYRGTLTVTPTDPPYLEFYDAFTSKAAALAVVAERLGIERTAVLAFGDGNNDAPMLAWAGLGVAMDHARPSARRAARLVAPDGDPRSSLARAVRAALAYDPRARRAS